MGDEEVRQVGGGEMVEGFKGEEEYLENDALSSVSVHAWACVCVCVCVCVCMYVCVHACV